MDFEDEIKQEIKKQLKLDVELEIPPSPEMGDFAMPCFQFSKKYKKDPKSIAKEFQEKLQISGVDVTNLGPYLNFFIDKGKLSEKVLTEVYSKKFYGKGKATKKTYVVDYSGPNVAKHMGIHNLRSTVIGGALYNILKYDGNKVIGVNHLGDWGTNFGQLIVGIKKYSSLSKIKTVKDLNEIYVKFHKNAENDDNLNEQAREWFNKLESGNAEAKRYWKHFVDISLKDYNRIYDRLNVKFDSVKGESEYIDLVSDVIKKLRGKKLVVKSEEATVVDLGEDMPPLILKKSDGSTIYASRDLAAFLYRIKKYSPEKILYVVDIAQTLHFKQLKKTLAKLKPEYGDVLEHVVFGRLKFKDMQMSTRKGKIVVLEEVLDRATDKILDIINEKNPGLKNKKAVSEAIGVGAIIFNDLYNDRVHDIVFDWKKVLDLEGDSGPYVQYAYARCNSILKKYGQKPTINVDFRLINEESEVELVKAIKSFQSIISQAASSYKPSILAKYLVHLARLFNNFYGSCQVISTDDKITLARILLVDSTRKVLAQGLELLGIEHPEEM